MAKTSRRTHVGQRDTSTDATRTPCTLGADLHAEKCDCLADQAGERRCLVLRFRAEEIGFFTGEALASLLLVEKVANKAGQPRKTGINLLAQIRRDRADDWVESIVRDVEPVDDPVDVYQAALANERCFSRLRACHIDGLLPFLEVVAHRWQHRHQSRECILGRRFPIPHGAREAIRALVLLGVVDVKPGSGTRVRTDALDRLSSAFGVRERLAELNARQLYEARRAIEAELAALAAVRATEAEVQQIGQAVRRLEMHQDDPEAFTQADLDFHRAVARAGRNPLLEQFYYSSERHLVAIIRNIIELPGVRARATELHRNTYRAIRARDPLRARRSVIAHMEYAQSLLEDDEDPTTALPTE